MRTRLVFRDPVTMLENAGFNVNGGTVQRRLRVSRAWSSVRTGPRPRGRGLQGWSSETVGGGGVHAPAIRPDLVFGFTAYSSG